MIKYIEDAMNAVTNGDSPAEALQTASSGFSQVLSSYGLSTSAQ